MAELESTQRTEALILRDSRLDGVPFVGAGAASEPIDENEAFLRSAESRERIAAAFARVMSCLDYL